ncbi:MAG TPA: LysR family transcriptional regulator [Burkholderiaceae bacterium]|nr:LysR family transcriptional regulator [Burkholderiaceae bacterium]
MANIHLHALRVFEEIYRTGCLSKTADKLGLTQPAISMWPLRIPNFLGLATIVGTTDHLCTLPRRAALIMRAPARWPPGTCPLSRLNTWSGSTGTNGRCAPGQPALRSLMS